MKKGDKISKEGMESRRTLKYMREEHKNKLELAVLNVMANDDEMKYFMGAIGGFGISSLSEYMEKQGYTKADASRVSRTSSSGSLAGFVMPGGDLVDGIVGNVGNSLSASCISILVLKSIFGEQGLSSLL